MIFFVESGAAAVLSIALASGEDLGAATVAAVPAWYIGLECLRGRRIRAAAIAATSTSLISGAPGDAAAARAPGRGLPG
eukprot:scaffold10025_cov119-Isochrysis_galbana.AAC.1